MSLPTVWIAIHDLSRSGVPIVLERMLRATRPDRLERVHVLALWDGPMRAAIEPMVGSVGVMEPVVGRSKPGALSAGLRSASWTGAAHVVEAVRWRWAQSRLPSPDVVVMHGAGAWPALAAVPSDVPVVMHLHELDSALERCIPDADRPEFLDRASRVMVVSAPVADMARRHGADSDRIVLVPGVADPRPIRDGAGARALLGDGTWVLGAGRPCWRKGTDRMSALAYELKRRAVGVDVGWVGGRPSGADDQWVGAADPVRWFPEMSDPWSLLAGAAAIVVPSREDPLPLVALEAGRHRLPVVATATGGLPALLASGRGLVADSQRLDSLSGLLNRVLGSPDLAASLGASLAQYVDRHHRADVVAPLWWEVIHDAAESGGGRRKSKRRRFRE